ncbi:MAG: hypothetical protein U1D30_16410 [Planctomycetota bacterium]
MLKSRISLLCFMVASLSLGGMLLTANGPARQAEAAEAVLSTDAAAWKTLVPEKDLETLVKLQVEELKKSMTSKATFQRGFRKAELTGYLVAGLGNVGVVTLEGDAAKKAATLREAGLTLAKAAKEKNYDEAKKASDTIGEYPAKIAPAADATPAKFTDVLPLDPLMKGVSAIDSAAGAAVRKDDKFKKDAKDLSAQAQLLAILSVVARDHNEAEDWKGWCDEMREASVNLSKQFGKRDLEGSKAARGTLQKSCTDCHDVYRKEE